MKKTDWLIILFIIISSIYTLRDLFKPYFFTSHDGPHQVVRLYYFDRLLRDGQIPPRYVSDLNNGWGYPLFEFSYQMPWFLAEPFYFSGFSLTDSIEFSFLTSYILSGITMYFFLKKLFNRTSAFTGAVVFLLAPNRFLNIFVRAAIGDATAYIFPPLMFLSLYLLAGKSKIDWKFVVLGAFALSGLILSHAMVFMFFYISFILYALFIFFVNENRQHFLKAFILINIFGFALVSYYFIPSLIERNLTVFSQVMSIYLANTFIDIKSLLYSPWGYGMMKAQEGGMSFQVGIAQWTGIVLCIISFISSLFIIRHNHKINKARIQVLFFLILFVLTILALLPGSGIFWDNIKKFAVIDFTWRLMPVTVFAASIVAAGSVYLCAKLKWLPAVILIILAVYSNRNHTRINKSLDWSVPFYLELEKTTNSNDEYTPKWVNQDITRKKIDSKVQFSDNNAIINIENSRSNYLKAGVDAIKEGKLKINTIYYPGWEVYINGKKTEFEYKNEGIMELNLAKGEYLVEAKFKETSFRRICNYISLLTFIILIGLVLWERRKC